MNIIFYEQRLAEFREEVKKMIKTHKISLRQYNSMLEDAEEGQPIPEFLISATIEIGLLQQLVWAHEQKIEDLRNYRKENGE